MELEYNVHNCFFLFLTQSEYGDKHIFTLKKKFSTIKQNKLTTFKTMRNKYNIAKEVNHALTSPTIREPVLCQVWTTPSAAFANFNIPCIEQILGSDAYDIILDKTNKMICAPS